MGVGNYSPLCQMSPSYLINHHWPSSIKGPESNTITIYPADVGGLDCNKGPFSVSASSCTSDDPKLVVESQVESPSSTHSQTSVSTPEPPELDQGESLDTPPSPPKNENNATKWAMKMPEYENISSNDSTPQRKKPSSDNVEEVLEKSNILNTPLKALSDAAKKLFVEDLDGNQKMNLVFISPSKRQPRRIPLIKVAKNVDSPDKKNLFLSSWEEQFNVKDLDKHRTTKDGEEASDENYQDTSSQCSSTVYSNDCSTPSSLASDRASDFEGSNQSFLENETTRSSENSCDISSLSFVAKNTHNLQGNSKAIEATNKNANDDCIFKTPIKTPSKSTYKRYRALSSSSESPSPKRAFPSAKPIFSYRKLESSPKHLSQSLFGTPEKLVNNDQNIQSFPSPNEDLRSMEDCSKKRYEDQKLSPHVSMVTRRSPRLKNGAVKSLFNMNGTSGEQKNPHVQHFNFVQKGKEVKKLTSFEPVNSSFGLLDEKSYSKNEVLLDLDVNRPLVTQLTPRKKTPQSEGPKEILKHGIDDSQKLERDESSSTGSNKMLESLSKALGLFPIATSSEKVDSFGPSNTVFTSEDTSSISQDKNIETKTLENWDKSHNGTKSLSFSTCSAKITEAIRTKGDMTHQIEETNDKGNNSFNGIVGKNIVNRIAQTNGKEESVQIQTGYEIEKSKKISIKEKIGNEQKITKLIKKKVLKKAKELESLVKENIKSKSLENTPWRNPEDVKRAYSELNLIPPLSPNKVT